MIQRSSRHQKRKISFFIPLIITVCILIGAITAIRWILQTTSQGEPSKQPVAHFTLLTGTARMLFSDGLPVSIEPSTSNHNLNIGEGLETIGKTRVQITLQDGSIVRLDGNTSLVISDFSHISNKKKILLSLNKGTIWVKIANPEMIQSFRVLGRISWIDIEKGIFSISRDSVKDVYQGISGNSQVSLTGPEKKQAIQNTSLQMGQQTIISDQELQNARDNIAIEFLTILESTFLSSDWYNYNHTLDTDGNITINTNNNNLNPLSNNNTNAKTIVGSSTFSITEPKDGDIVTTDVLEIKGTATSNTEKVIINDYTLKQYKPGSSTWFYRSAVAYGNLQEGQNTFTIYTMDSNGKKSPEKTITITYKKNAVTNDIASSSNNNTTEASPEENTNKNTYTTEQNTDKISLSITAPINGDSYKTTNNKIIISGTVSGSAQQIIVNGFSLKKFIPGSTTWQYYAYEEFGSLKEGENTYTIHAVDTDGHMSASDSITITYQKTAPSVGTGSTL